MMHKRPITIDHIPALLWGEPAARLMIAVHGDVSHKEDVVIAQLAEAATGADYQVLSFDLPEHGDRQGLEQRCDAQTCVAELGTVLRYARTLGSRISLFGCSLGAYFSLVAYAGTDLEQCLFLSPVVDMKHLIDNMMLWAGVNESQLQQAEEIPTAFGKTLYWDYYCYVKEHPIEKWKVPTAILCGETDTVSEFDCVAAFANRFCCDVTVMPGGEHFFHTAPQLHFYWNWLVAHL